MKNAERLKSLAKVIMIVYCVLIAFSVLAMARTSAGFISALLMGGFLIPFVLIAYYIIVAISDIATTNIMLSNTVNSLNNEIKKLTQLNKPEE